MSANNALKNEEEREGKDRASKHALTQRQSTLAVRVWEQFVVAKAGQDKSYGRRAGGAYDRQDNAEVSDHNRNQQRQPQETRRHDPMREARVGER